MSLTELYNQTIQRVIVSISSFLFLPEGIFFKNLSVFFNWMVIIQQLIRKAPHLPVLAYPGWELPVAVEQAYR